MLGTIEGGHSERELSGVGPGRLRCRSRPVAVSVPAGCGVGPGRLRCRSRPVAVSVPAGCGVGPGRLRCRSRRLNEGQPDLVHRPFELLTLAFDSLDPRFHLGGVNSQLHCLDCVASSFRILSQLGINHGTANVGIRGFWLVFDEPVQVL